ncbi:MAG: MetQ/NlpA family ABC transporter substrate-binding protein [Treponema sp.]|nr:MetQ/NlpA family ABC transporter substrate-binding protein [Treponema sp.]
MKKITKILGLVLVSGFIFTSVTGCAKKGGAEEESLTKKTLKYSQSAGPYSVLFDREVRPILEKQGYKFVAYDYSNLSLADDALNGGDVDFNVEQHTAYAKNWNEGNGGDLVVITPIPTVPAGLFSDRYKSADDIKKLSNPTIAIPNDPANTARAYLLLEKIGWITLKDGIDKTKAVSTDVKDNPYGLVITEMSSTNIPPVLGDFDFAVITGSIVYNAGIDASTALAQETVLDHLLLQVTVKEKNKDAQWAKDIVNAYHSVELKEHFASTNNENGLWYVPEGYWNDASTN